MVPRCTDVPRPGDAPERPKVDRALWMAGALSGRLVDSVHDDLRVRARPRSTSRAWRARRTRCCARTSGRRSRRWSADRRRALVVQRTGWGKSAVYFVATALLRGQGAGPDGDRLALLALMRNQIEAAERAGIRAVDDQLDQHRGVGSDQPRSPRGEVDVLLVSPERLNNPGFRDEVLPRLAATAGLLVVDEAHCISDWGHDFRPDYRRIRTMLAELPDGIPVLATTATANARVTADVAEQLGSEGRRRRSCCAAPRP